MKFLYVDRRCVFLIQGCIHNLIERTWPNKKSHPISGIFLCMNLTAGVADMADGRGCLLSARYYRDFVAGKRAEIISQKRTLFRSVIPSKTELA